METKRQTPETDAICHDVYDMWSKIPHRTMVEVDFAGKLEIERDSAHELLREIRDNEVNPQDEADKFLRDGVCSELSKCREYIDELEGRSVHSCGDHCQRPSCVKRHEREKLILAQAAQIVALREALSRIHACTDSPDIDVGGEMQIGLHCGVEDRGCRDRYDGADVGWSQGVERTLEWAQNEAAFALNASKPPAVVPLEDVRPLVEAAENTRHWHDTSFNPETGKTEGVIVSAKSFWTLKEALATFTAKHPL